MHIYLASRSPRRIELLAQMGLDCSVCPADIDESTRNQEIPSDYVKRVAQAKLQACIAQNLTTFDRHIRQHQTAVIIAADTTVAINHTILGKPDSAEEAEYMLKQLSDSVHLVHTAVAGVLVNNQGYSEVQTRLSSTQVRMHAITNTQIADYIARGEYQDKAGGYGIQGVAATWIQEITGSYSGVMGLPVFETAQILRQFGVYP